MTAYASTYTECAASVVDAVRLDATADATRVSNWLNRRLVEVAVKSRYFSGSATGSALAALATTQALPTTLVELEYITCTFGGQVTVMYPKNYEQILQMRTASQSGASGPPVYYCLRKATVEFWPTAQGGEVLTYYGATVPDVWAGSAASGLPEPYGSELLIAGACQDAADFKGDPKLFFYYQGYYQQLMGEFMAFLNLRVTQQGRAFPIQGPDGRPITSSGWRPHDPSTDLFGVTW